MNTRNIVSISLTVLIIIKTGLLSFAQDPFVPKYDAYKRSERCFTVTSDIPNQFGSVWWSEKIDFSQDTLFNFVVYMGDKNDTGADGLAYVMHKDPRDTITDFSKTVSIAGNSKGPLAAATGDDGGGLGYAYMVGNFGKNYIPGIFPEPDKDNHKIQPSVAIEIDTYYNKDNQDGKNGPYQGEDHTSVVYNGDLYGQQQTITDRDGNTGEILPLKPDYAFGVGNNNIEDDGCYTFQIEWDVLPDGTQDLKLYADTYDGTTNTGGLQLIMTHNDDMITNVFGGDATNMRFGFTGSTGGYNNEQTICLLGENLAPYAVNDSVSIAANTSKVIDVKANDNDPDNDFLYVPAIIDFPKNGNAVIIDSLNISFLRYTPIANYTGKDSLSYVTCDVNSTKCYAKCDTAMVYITVGCVPFDVQLTATSPNTICSDLVPANGAAEATVISTFMRGTLWYEGFEGDVFSGDTNDNGTTAWTSTTSGSCDPSSTIRVETISSDNIFSVNYSVCEVLFETEIIDISGVSDVGVTVDLKSAGGLETSDKLEVYYKLDGGAITPFVNGIHSTDFGTALASVNGLNGSTLQIVILAMNTANDENYYWDNIHVTAIGAGVPDVTYNWYDGATASGPISYTGAINNGITDGVYTVIAIDNATACASNPATVTVDSIGQDISGGYIEQLAPYTDCAIDNGALGAGVMVGSNKVTAGYSFEWYYQEDPKIPAFIRHTGFSFPNLVSREYSVIITENASGCDTTINEEVINEVITPILTATKLADITSCSDPNTGSGAASVGGVTNGYDFEWYIGGAIGAGPADYTTPTVNTFPIGTYTVQVIDTGTSCVSESRSISITDQSVVPEILVTVVSEQTSCDTLALTGEFSGAVNEAGVPTTAGYTFNWYKGPNDIITARSGYIGGPTVDSLEAGAYRLVAITNGTNCTSFVDTLIQDMTVTPPDVALAVTHVTSCAVPNGTITITPVGNPADYTYEFYNGLGVVVDSLIIATNSASLINLPIGNYTAIAIDKVTKCATNPASITVNDITAIPTASFVAADQVSCDPLNFTGGLIATVGAGVAADYTFEWFSDNLVTSIGGNSEVLSLVDSGNYALRLTHNTSQCLNVYYPRIDEVITLPIVTVTSIPTTYCGAAVNGEVHALADGVTAGYTFDWTSVLSGNLGVATADVTGLPADDYTVTATNNTTKCISNAMPITIADTPIIPTAAFVSIDQTWCDVPNFNGGLTATVGAGVPLDYTFEWFSDNLVTGIGGNNEILALVDSGVYALRLTHNTSQCSNVYYQRIDEVITLPVVSVTSVPTTYCGAAVNGELHALADGVTAGYTFDWIAALSGNLGVTTADVTLLPADDYTVSAMNNTTKCVSNAMPVTIADTPIIPTATFVSADQTWCDAPNFNGGLTATVGAEVPAVYTFEWFSDNLLTSVGGNNEVLSLVDSGDYALRLTHNTSQCLNVYYARINEVITLPVVTVTSVPTTYCGAAVNGEVHALADGVPAGYTFDWTSILSGNLGVATADVTGLPADDYTVTATNDISKCVSNVIPLTIADTPIIPTATFTSVDQASCDPLNLLGQLSATVGAGVAADYTFEWFLDNLLTGIGGNSEVLSLVDSGDYALRLTNNTSLCSNIYYNRIDRVITLPILTVSSIPTTNCGVAVNGELHALADGIKPGYTFDWNSLLSGNLGITTADVLNLPADDYSLTATNNTTKCISNAALVTIDDASVPPSFNLLSFNNISCDPANPVGSLIAQRPDASYTVSQYEWFNNLPIPANAIGGPTFVPDSTVLNLGSGDFAVRVTDNVTQCKSVEYATILDLPANNPLIDTVYTKAVTKCIGPDGELGLKVVAIEQIPPLFSQNRTYTFNISNAPDVYNLTSDPSSARPDTVSFVNLGSGNWISTVEDDFTHCVSAPLTINLSEAPGVVISRLDSILPADCGGVAIGSFQFKASSVNNPELIFPTPANPAADIGFTFAWEYQGTQFQGPAVANPGTVDGAKTDGFREWRDDLLAGYYIVLATDYYSDCVASDTVYIPVADAPPSVASVGQDAQDCIPGDGRIDFQVNGNAGHGLVTDYNVILYSGSTADPANQKRIEPLLGVYGELFHFGAGGAGTNYPEAIPPGNYTIVTQEKVAPFCLSVPTVVTVGLDLTTPTIAASTLTDDFSCKPASGTGELTALATDNDNLDNSFDYKWYQGVDASGVSFANTATISGQEAGTFTVKATDTNGRGNGCSYEQTINLPKVLKDITLTSSVINNSNCGPFQNGEAQITNIAEGGVDIGVLPGGYYNFSLLYDASTLADPSNNTAAAFSALAPGDYYLRAQNGLTDCFTKMQSITIDDLTQNPDISITVNSLDYSCTPGSESGDLEADIGGVTAGYDFNWYMGTIAAPNFVVNASRATGLTGNYSSQLYTIEVQDTDGTDGNLGCTSSKEYTLVHQPVKLIILNANVASTDQTICAPNGSMLLTKIVEDNGFGPIDITPDFGLEYHARLLDQNLNPIALPYATFTALSGEIGSNNIPAGNYYVQAQKVSTACGYSPATQVIIDDLSRKPIVSVVQESPDYACLGGTPTGILAPTISGGSDGDGVLGNFTISWTPEVPGPPIVTDNGLGTYADKAIGLAFGDYQIVVSDNSSDDLGCVTTMDYTVTSDRQGINLTGISTDQTICADNGTIQLTALSGNIGGVPLAVDPGWQVSLLDANKAEVNPGVTITGVAGVDDTFSGLGDGTYFIQSQNNFTLCYSEPLQFVIADLSTNPDVTIVQESPDYACAGGTPTGILAPTIVGGSDGDGAFSNFTISWTSVVPGPPIVTDNGLGTYADKATGLASGDYQIVVTDNSLDDLGCVTTMNYTLTSVRQGIDLTGIWTDQTICADNGTIQITGMSGNIGGVPLVVDPGWQVSLLDANKAAVNPGVTITGVTGVDDTFAGLGAATYFIQAQNNFTLCYSEPIQFVIEDLSTNPDVVIAQDSPDYSCVGGTPTGILNPSIMGGTDGDGTLSNFTVSWTSLSGANPVATDASESAIGLIPGDYRIVVTDNSLNDLGCVTTMDYSLTSIPQGIDLTGISTDQMICIENGTIQVTGLSGNISGVPLAVDPGWQVSLLDENKVEVNPGVTITGVTGVDDTFTGLGDATYFIQAQNDFTKCYSEPLQFVIADVSTNPIIDVDMTSPQYSLNPNPLSWTGVLKASVVELGTGVADPLGYSYSWHNGMETSSPSLSALDSMSALDVGVYTLVARSNSTFCVSEYTEFLPFQYLEPTFNTYERAKTICFPANGSIEVTDIDLDGNPDLLSDYTFNWHHDVYSSGDVPDAIIAGDDTRTAYDNVDAGTYYIIAREDWWMLDSYPLRVDVVDSSSNPIIQVDPATYSNLKSCFESIFADGAIAVDIYEDPSNPYVNFPYITAPFSYGYTWYNGNVADPVNVITDSTNRVITGLTTGDFTLVVENLGNNCKSERTFTIEDESITPIITPSQVSNTSCEPARVNGDAIADINNSVDLYTYSWYEGTDASGTPAYIGQVWPGRSMGVYTVVAVDQRTGTCFSEPTTVNVEEALVFPTLLVTELSPVTNCDPERPNGVLSAVTQDGIEGHTFEWYLAGDLYDEGPTASKFGLLNYQLLATNDVTQCATTMQAYATPLFSVVPSPDVTVINEMTSCAAPDGIVTASISNEVTEHIFRFYDKSSNEELTNFYEDSKMYDMEDASYFVTAEDRNTGCVSDSAEFSISNDTYYPEIDISSIPSGCTDPTGSANVIISDESQDYEVTWYGDNGFREHVKELVYIPSGNYRVEVEGTDGCISTDEVEIKRDVLVYNGVSPNNDGFNDFFKIVCLEHFPDNSVRIYNRGGLLVYEQTFYDGNDPSRRFDGASNKGLSIIGSELPIGTYYYVIDKNDGSTAKVGYLELNR